MASLRTLPVQLYRVVWIYIAIHDLANSSPSKGGKPWKPAYRRAAIKIAQELTPLLVAGGELDIDQVDAGKHAVDRWTLDKIVIRQCQPCAKYSCEV